MIQHLIWLLMKNKIASCFEKKRLDKLCRSFSGGTPSKDNKLFWIGNIPWASPKDMKEFYLSETEDYISEDAVKNSSTNIAPENSMLIVFRSGILQHTIPVAVTIKNMAFNQDIKALIFKENIIPAYTAYFFTIYQSKLIPLLVKHSTTVQSINSAQFDRLEIPVPPLAMQSAIVAKMDAAYASKKEKEAEAQRLLDSIDDYLLGELGIELPEQEENTIQSRIFTRRFSEISGGRLDPIYFFAKLESFHSGKYESFKLSSIASDFSSGVGAGKQDQVFELDGIIQIRPTNIDQYGNLKYDKNVYLANDFQGGKIKKDDVLFNNTNSQVLVGKTAVLKEERDLFFSNHITKITVDKKKAVPDYLMLVLNSYQKHRVFFSICTNWNNQSGIGLDLLKSLKIPLPPLSVQTEIADHIAQIRSRAKQLQQEAVEGLEQAKLEVEAMLLGDSSETL